MNAASNSGNSGQASNLTSRPYQTINVGGVAMNGNNSGVTATNTLLNDSSAIAANAYANHDFTTASGGQHQTLDHHVALNHLSQHSAANLGQS